MSIDIIQTLITTIAKLPGLGPRSAKRIVLQMIQNIDSLMLPMAEQINSVASNIQICNTCHNVDSSSTCKICNDPQRDVETICVVESIADLWAIENAKFFHGVYHVLGGNISALEGRMPENLNMESLKQRIINKPPQEIIIATNSTMEGQTTCYYLLEMLKPFKIKATRLAHGIPIGGELEYMDDSTLSLALKLRQDL